MEIGGQQAQSYTRARAHGVNGDENAAILAHHFVHAHDERGLHYLIRAGTRARQLYANNEAIGFFRV